MSATKIEWADLTINPVVGCSKCSPGCENCYAERFAARLAKNPLTAAKYAEVVDEAGKWTGRISTIDLSVFDKLPNMPKRIFVGSMTDMFLGPYRSEFYCASWMDEFFDKILSLGQHTFILLTKREQNMQDWINAYYHHNRSDVIENLWLGVTVCNQAEADAKIPVLLDTPAEKRFLSVEPMLGLVDLQEWFWKPTGRSRKQHGKRQLELAKASGIDWVICGGETGHLGRPMYPDWARGLRDQCHLAGVPFFFKGWGKWMTLNQTIFPAGKRPDRRLLDKREWNEVPE